MSDVIQLLPDSVANQIAAGEVIQRPASVIKELVENAVDAGAKTIHVLVVDAGRTSIQVIDDGCGMSETDARLSFERHATSKIRKADDLFALQTMGFRGEALASIAAVAQIELKTRRAEDELGTHLSISGSRFTGQEPCACPVGSNFMIENLFFNVPARRKFLKSNTTELNNILTAFERIALVYPEITFTLHSNGVEVFNLRASNTRQRIVDIFGKKLNQQLLPVSVDTSICRLSGFVGKPEAARKKNAHQYFFVNGRYMKHPYFNKAIQSAYERLVPADEQVPYFVYFTVEPQQIDVNIHPTKTEIKFENEQAIWQIVAAATRDSIGLFSEVPTIEFDTVDKPDIPVYNPDARAVQPKLDTDSSYNPFNENTVSQKDKALTDWQQLYDGLQGETTRQATLFDSETTQGGHEESILSDKAPVHYQYKGRYIMTSVKSGLMIIDQHRAHVRILYNVYIDRLNGSQNATSQRLLFPEMVQFPPSEQVVLQKITGEMSAMGFDLADLGNGNYGINGVPGGLEGIDAASLVQDMVATAMDSGSFNKNDIHHSLALSMARHAAIPYGQVLGNDEMDTIVNELFASNDANYTPDGKRTLTILRQDEIEKLLG